ncbi:hypothetical protein ACFOEM_11840 [Paenalcaligenes hominis]|uniref:hypothetical protein n=1 Tax=Paenalcaligenes hominis TaxID=643674 RepID=UPI00361DB85A
MWFIITHVYCTHALSLQSFSCRFTPWHFCACLCNHSLSTATSTSARLPGLESSGSPAAIYPATYLNAVTGFSSVNVV